MIVGAHESVAGGWFKAVERAQIDGARALQVFTKNSGMWREPELDDAAVQRFRQAHLAAGHPPVLAHTSYLINLATDGGELMERSITALVAEVQRSSALGIAYCVLHPGAHLGKGEDEALDRVAAALDEVHARTPDATAKILLENTAGQGTCVGHTFGHLGRIFERAAHPERLGVCLDTQHMFAAGYDLVSEEGYARAFRELEAEVGLANVRAFHLNDSKKPLGSRVDRHEHIGEGLLGLPTFWRLINDLRFAEIPGVVETEPREGDAPYRDEVALLNGLRGAPQPKPAPPVFQLELAPAADAKAASSGKTSRKKRSS
jgi:deoxyribonuclease-4